MREAVLNGLHSTAYDVFLNHDRQHPEAAYNLHPAFDERPGDLYDILRDDMSLECAKLERKYKDEINMLREMLYRHGDMIRELNKKLAPL